MRRIGLLFLACLCSLFLSAQTCKELQEEFEYLETKYKKLTNISEKKECVKQMELVIRRGKEANCEFPKKWYNEVSQWKRALYPNTIFAQSTYAFDASSDVVQICVKQNKNLKLVSSPTWFKKIETEDSKCFDFSMEENELPYPRSGVIEVEDASKKRHQCTITQEAAPLRVNVTERIGFGQDASASFIFVETNDTAWTVSGGDSWLTTEWAEYGAKVTCTANPTKKKRSSKIKVKLACGETKTVEVEQSIGRTTLSVPQRTFTFDNSGGKNNNVEVQCNYDQWSASSDFNWVKVQKKYGGISIECSPNNLAKSRTATIKIETNDADHLVEYITVIQDEAPAYLYAEQSSYRSDGNERTITVAVKTNIPSWSAYVDQGSGWTTASRSGDNSLKVYLKRNDWNSARTSEVKLYGKGKSYTISFTQPNRGYAGRYNDYFNANGGDWRVTWFSLEAGVLTSIGMNVSTINARWKPVELSLLNFNFNYNFLNEGFNVGWEPVVRGYLPISRDGRWSAFVGLGAHVDFIEDSHFLMECGMECQWEEKYSSRIFFKYNGGCVLGMSFDIGTWY